MGFARYLMNDGRFDDLGALNGLNSHMPMNGRYRAMLAHWRKNDQPRPMNEAQIRELLSVR